MFSVSVRSELDPSSEPLFIHRFIFHFMSPNLYIRRSYSWISLITQSGDRYFWRTKILYLLWIGLGFASAPQHPSFHGFTSAFSIMRMTPRSNPDFLATSQRPRVVLQNSPLIKRKMEWCRSLFFLPFFLDLLFFFAHFRFDRMKERMTSHYAVQVRKRHEGH